MTAALKTIWTIINLAPTAAAKVAEAATGSAKVAMAVQAAGTLDWFTPGPVVSGTLIVVFGAILLAKKARQFAFC